MLQKLASSIVGAIDPAADIFGAAAPLFIAGIFCAVLMLGVSAVRAAAYRRGNYRLTGTHLLCHGSLRTVRVPWSDIVDIDIARGRMRPRLMIVARSRNRPLHVFADDFTAMVREIQDAARTRSPLFRKKHEDLGARGARPDIEYIADNVTSGDARAETSDELERILEALLKPPQG